MRRKHTNTTEKQDGIDSSTGTYASIEKNAMRLSGWGQEEVQVQGPRKGGKFVGHTPSRAYVFEQAQTVFEPVTGSVKLHVATFANLCSNKFTHRGTPVLRPTLINPHGLVRGDPSTLGPVQGGWLHSREPECNRRLRRRPPTPRRPPPPPPPPPPH